MTRTFILGLLGLMIGLPSSGEISIVEIPIRVERPYARRTPGSAAFYIIFRDNFGEVIAIPEEEVARFRKLAIDEGFDMETPTSYDYLPHPQQAVGNTAKATITIEHLDALSFWMDDTYSFFITWDDEHPAPIPVLDGIAIADIYAFNPATLPPSAPQPVTILP